MIAWSQGIAVDDIGKCQASCLPTRAALPHNGHGDAPANDGDVRDIYCKGSWILFCSRLPEPVTRHSCKYCELWNSIDTSEQTHGAGLQDEDYDVRLWGFDKEAYVVVRKPSPLQGALPAVIYGVQ